MTKFIQRYIRYHSSHWSLPKRLRLDGLLRSSSLLFYSTTMGHHDPILKGKYPAKAHCAKVAAYLKERVKDDTPARIYLQGQKTRMIEDNDETQPFRSDCLMAKSSSAG